MDIYTIFPSLSAYFEEAYESGVERARLEPFEVWSLGRCPNPLRTFLKEGSKNSKNFKKQFFLFLVLCAAFF